MLHSLRNETYVRLHELKELLWIDRATRFISVDFTVYNANLNLFSIAKYTNSVYCFLRCDYIVPFLKVLTISLTRERKRYLNPHPSYSHYIRVCLIRPKNTLYIVYKGKYHFKYSWSSVWLDWIELSWIMYVTKIRNPNQSNWRQLYSAVYSPMERKYYLVHPTSIDFFLIEGLPLIVDGIGTHLSLHIKMR